MGDFILKNTTCLADMSISQSALVVGFEKFIDNKIKRRLLELGFYLGAKVTLAQTSFLNDVLLVELNGYLLSLRKTIAKQILVNLQH